MKFSVERDKLLGALQRVSGVVERKSSQPILSHFMLYISSHQLRITGTDLEVEITALLTLIEPAESGEVTLPARKLLDICRALPEGSQLNFTLNKEKVSVLSGKSRFYLATLPAESFPRLEAKEKEVEFEISSHLLSDMLERTLFAVANQDVRFYLNGLLMQTKDGDLYSVATDGHRLSMFNAKLDKQIPNYSIIIPRKAVSELQRLLANTEEELAVGLTKNNITINGKDYIFISKLIEGNFPDYQAVIPKNNKVKIVLDRDDFRNALSRVSILSNEKYRGVNLQLSKGMLHLSSKNPEHEQAEEELAIEYEGDSFDVGFNVGYILDVLNHVPPGNVEFALEDASQSVLIKSLSDDYNCLFVVMPMRI